MRGLSSYLQDKSDVTLVRVKKPLQIRIEVVNDEFVDADDSRDDANVEQFQREIAVARF